MEDFKKILIPTDGSEANNEAVEKGLSLARLMGARATILFVVDTSSFIDILPDELVTNITSIMEKQGNEYINEIIEEADELGVETEKKITTGHPAQEIINESENHDMIVIGTHGRSGLSRIFLGSTAEKVVRHAKCPVMLIKIKEEEE